MTEKSRNMRREDAAALVDQESIGIANFGNTAKEGNEGFNKVAEKTKGKYSSTENVHIVKPLIGPIPANQKPFWRFLLLAIIGLIAYSIYNWQMRKRLKMRAAASATWGEVPDTNGIPTTMVLEPAQKGKGVGKGFGKVLGKNTSKGSKGAEQGRKGSSFSIESTFSMSKLWAFVPFLAKHKPVDGQDSGSKGGKAVGKGKKGRASESSMVQDLVVMVRSVEKIQAVWRRFRASLKAPPKDKQLITLVCDVLAGKHMPNVNRFGGCDPFVECRIVQGDPTHRLRGDLDKEALFTAKTGEKRNDMAPSWNQKLTLTDLTYDKDMYVQLVLWDYNLAGNKPIGHVALPLASALSAYGPKRPERALSFTSLPGCEEWQLKATVSAKFSFLETSP